MGTSDFNPMADGSNHTSGSYRKALPAFGHEQDNSMFMDGPTNIITNAQDVEFERQSE